MKARFIAWSNRLFIASFVCIICQLGVRGCNNGVVIYHALDIMWFITIIPGVLLWVVGRFFLKADSTDEA